MSRKIDMENVIIAIIGIILITSAIMMVILSSFRSDEELKLFEQSLNQKVAIERLVMRME